MGIRDWKIVRKYKRRLLKLTHGRLFDTARGGRKVLLLTTTGRKSGQPRTVVLVYTRDGEYFIVFASNQGKDRPPAWWLNLQKDPNAVLHVKGQKFNVIARKATDLEDARLWPKAMAYNSHWEEFRARAKRHLPLVILRPY